MRDLKTLVRELADSLQAIYEAQGPGFSIEVPLAHERYQSVLVTEEGPDLALVTRVGDIDGAAGSVLDRFRRKSASCRIDLEKDDAGRGTAVIRARVPASEATAARLEPLLKEIAGIGDALERELTGGDVD